MYLYEELSQEVYNAASEVYDTLGSGFLEKVYEKAFIVELNNRGIKVEAQKPLEIYYKGTNVGTYYADIVIEDKIIVELKAQKMVAHENFTQLLNYLRASGLRLGLLINFGGEKLFVKRLIN